MIMEPNDPTRTGPAISDLPPSAVLSRNEIEALCTKAARGAGLSWGHAEEAGFAAGWLHAHGIDGSAALLAHLDRRAGMAWADVCPAVGTGRWQARGRGPICSIALGAALSDHCGLPEGALNEGLSVGPVSQPILVLPFLSRMAEVLGHAVLLCFDGGEICVDSHGTSGDTGRLTRLAEASFGLSLGTHPDGSGCLPVYDCAHATLTALGDLAMRTTVPPSERSRADAGAGTADND